MRKNLLYTEANLPQGFGETLLGEKHGSIKRGTPSTNQNLSLERCFSYLPSVDVLGDRWQVICFHLGL